MYDDADDENEPWLVREPTRGDEVVEAYAGWGCGKGSEGNRSFTYDGR